MGPYLQGARRVLDLGASDGRLISSIRRSLADDQQFDVVGCDTHVQPDAVIPVTRYDGANLPFDDNSFDCVTLIDVLHHDTDPARVMAEAKRVSNDRILIKDHFWRSRLDVFSLKVMDYIGNKPYGVQLPYNYLNEDEWSELLASLRLGIARSEKFRMNRMDPCRHVIYELHV
jgi:SAM-dependent methyltransferase